MKQFAQIVENLSQPKITNQKSVSENQYNQWKRQYIFKALQGEEYGASFCKEFAITDYILHYFTKTHIDCDKYIRSNYIRKS